MSEYSRARTAWAAQANLEGRLYGLQVRPLSPILMSTVRQVARGFKTASALATRLGIKRRAAGGRLAAAQTFGLLDSRIEGTTRIYELRPGVNQYPWVTEEKGE